MNLGKAIKLCRTQRDLSQAQLAALAGVSVSYLSLLERGKRDPNFGTVQRVADALAVPLSVLVFLAADRDELGDFTPGLSEKLAYAALRLMEGPPVGEACLPT